MDNTQQFCKIVKQRSAENRRAIHVLHHSNLTGQIMSVLRQELDSMVRVLYLLNHSITERDRLISLTMNGQKWKTPGNKQITDREMVDLADSFHGWANSVYKFGCAFIHLSLYLYHEYAFNDSFKNLDFAEISSIKSHLNSYHGYPISQDLTMESIAPFLPMVFNKIADNAEYYINNLEAGHTGPLY